MAVLDTSFLIDLFRNEQTAVELLKELERKEEGVVVTAPTMMELWLGAMKSHLPEKRKAEVEELIGASNVLSLDTRAAKQSAEIQVQLGKKGTPIQLEDVMIAGIAISNGETVVTRDEGYAKVPNLRMLKY